ncbi:hypothetical protein [Geodermatophilus ruber]|uniref:hypothetical protein n=1 Tax=Geodermatophilus ruber TaxID=504800 RepID=UPI0015A699C4|nr:hypothetical protein [Geodermatophilus ruber]
MGDGDRRPAPAGLDEGRLHRPLGAGVQRAGRLVEHQHPGIARQRPGDRLRPGGLDPADRASLSRILTALLDAEQYT